MAFQYWLLELNSAGDETDQAKKKEKITLKATKLSENILSELTFIVSGCSPGIMSSMMLNSLRISRNSSTDSFVRVSFSTSIWNRCASFWMSSFQEVLYEDLMVVYENKDADLDYTKLGSVSTNGAYRNDGGVRFCAFKNSKRSPSIIPHKHFLIIVLYHVCGREI